MTVNEIAAEVGISHGNAQVTMIELQNFRKFCAVLTSNKLEEIHSEILEYSSYSLNLSHCDYFLLAPLKEALEGEQFENSIEKLRNTCTIC